MTEQKPLQSNRTQPARIPLMKPVFDEEMKDAAVHALQNERFVLGESVYKFEEEFASFCGTKYAVAVASGTAALTLSLIAKGIRGYDAVTSTFSFVGSSNPILIAGGNVK